MIRAYIEHRLDQRPGVQKLYYMGPMFRRERPQKGRYRQFYQIGAEAIGSESPAVDAEVIEMVVGDPAARRASMDFTVLLNSVGCPRLPPALRRAAARGAGRRGRRACARTATAAPITNPLRVLDCKVEADQPIIDALPSILDHLCEACRHALRRRAAATCDDRGIAFEIRPRLVRGLDYYMRTTFEVVHGALGAQNSVLGGGRYDGLAEALGSKVHAPGHRLLDRRRPPGDDRRRAAQAPAPRSTCSSPRWAKPPCGTPRVLARDLRARGVSVEAGADGKLKRALELANKLGARYALIVGENEIAAGRVRAEEHATGEQRNVGRDELAAIAES